MAKWAKLQIPFATKQQIVTHLRTVLESFGLITKKEWCFQWTILMKIASDHRPSLENVSFPPRPARAVLVCPKIAETDEK